MHDYAVPARLLKLLAVELHHGCSYPASYSTHLGAAGARKRGPVASCTPSAAMTASLWPGTCRLAYSGHPVRQTASALVKLWNAEQAGQLGRPVGCGAAMLAMGMLMAGTVCTKVL